jgi:hypothetical protein
MLPRYCTAPLEAAWIWNVRGAADREEPPEDGDRGPERLWKEHYRGCTALMLGKSRMVRNLTEHDFTGSCPTPSDRFAVPTLVDLVMFASPSSRYTTLPSG